MGRWVNRFGRDLPKKTCFFGIPFPNLFTHPRVFVRFGKTKGEIPVEKGNFRSDFSRGLDLVWESATPPTRIWENLKKKWGGRGASLSGMICYYADRHS